MKKDNAAASLRQRRAQSSRADKRMNAREKAEFLAAEEQEELNADAQRRRQETKAGAGGAAGKTGGRRKNGKTKRNEPAKLPPIAVLAIISRAKDGTLLARPHRAEAEDETEAVDVPLIALAVSGSAPAAGVGARVLAKIFPAKGEDKRTAPYQGRIIRILERQAKSVLGIVRQNAQGYFRLEPADRKQPELLLDAAALNGAKADDLVLAEMQDGGSKAGGRSGASHRPHFGRVKQIIGSMAEEKALVQIALYSHNIPAEFPAEAVAEARQAGTRSRPEAGKEREDWRHIPFITIDPQQAKDHDDAVFAEADRSPANQGGCHIYVAIADVAFYVRPNSAMDSEARRRGNSVYFPDKVVPMLPEEISNNLCSLREGEDRPALAVKITFDAHGRKIGHKFHRVLMRSRAKLSYSQAQAAIDGRADSQTAPLLEAVLRPLWAAYEILAKARAKRQPLELNLPERRLVLDENGHIIDIRTIMRLDAHRLIEEFMIAANIAAAETLKNSNMPLLFRIHDKPAPARQESLKEFLLSLGIKTATGAALTAEKLNGILAKAKNKDYEELVNQIVLRAQAQAEYNPVNIGHFGLTLRNYAHFTSPIRRYADVLIHRSLIKALKLGDDGLTAAEEADLDNIAMEISAVERRAQAAERETNDRLIAYYLSSHIGAHFSGRINGVTRAGLFITLDESGADGLAPISSLKDPHGVKDYYGFDEAHFALIGEHSRKGYQLGMRVEARLKEVNRAAGSLRFEILSPPAELPFSAKSFHKAIRRRPASRPQRGRPHSGSARGRGRS